MGISIYRGIKGFVVKLLGRAFHLFKVVLATGTSRKDQKTTEPD
jgi:hypothetical protein